MFYAVDGQLPQSYHTGPVGMTSPLTASPFVTVKLGTCGETHPKLSVLIHKLSWNSYLFLLELWPNCRSHCEFQLAPPFQSSVKCHVQAYSPFQIALIMQVEVKDTQACLIIVGVCGAPSQKCTHPHGFYKGEKMGHSSVPYTLIPQATPHNYWSFMGLLTQAMLFAGGEALPLGPTMMSKRT